MPAYSMVVDCGVCHYPNRKRVRITIESDGAQPPPVFEQARCEEHQAKRYVDMALRQMNTPFCVYCGPERCLHEGVHNG